jgi:spore germination protein YaaH
MPGALEYRKNNGAVEIAETVKTIAGNPYLPADIVGTVYPYNIEYREQYKLVIFTERGRNQYYSDATGKTEIRFRPGSDSPIVVRAEKGDRFATYEGDGDYTLVRTPDGLLGYILTSQIGYAETVPGAEINTASRYPPAWPEGLKINMMWEGVYNADANAVMMETPLPKGLNVVSPTWFAIDESAFNVTSLASGGYVQWAHSQNCAVWPLLSDVNANTCHLFLTDVQARRRAVAFLTDCVREYGLDGINVDFEHVKEEDAAYFIQFLRELAPSLRRLGASLSVDVYVPSAWSMYYRRDLIGITADFVCVMTYDEHYAGSPESGPVASIPFVAAGVEDMLKEVPKEKLLMGLPFYNRVWREIVTEETNENRKVSHFGMDRTVTGFLEHSAVFDWDPLAGCFYGEYAAVEEGETVLYRVWLEDENSISEKLKIFKANGLAGVAGWNRGFENEAVREMLYKTVFGR